MSQRNWASNFQSNSKEGITPKIIRYICDTVTNDYGIPCRMDYLRTVPVHHQQYTTEAILTRIVSRGTVGYGIRRMNYSRANYELFGLRVIQIIEMLLEANDYAILVKHGYSIFEIFSFLRQRRIVLFFWCVQNIGSIER